MLRSNTVSLVRIELEVRLPDIHRDAPFAKRLKNSAGMLRPKPGPHDEEPRRTEVDRSWKEMRKLVGPSKVK